MKCVFLFGVFASLSWKCLSCRHRRINKADEYGYYYDTTNNDKWNENQFSFEERTKYTGLTGQSYIDKYKNYKVIQTAVLNDLESQELSRNLSHKVDFWIKPRANGRSEFMIRPENVNDVEKFMRSHNIQFLEKINNVQKLLYHSMLRHRSFSENLELDKYHSYESMIELIYGLAEKHEDVMEIRHIGLSYEERDMIVVVIGKSFHGNTTNIFIEAGIHAREWISSATALYLIYALTESERSEKILKRFTIHIVPLANPDGYEFSRTEDRLWRKTRTPQKKCKGVDLNRNWDFHYGGKGSNEDSCSTDYRGPEPFSEPESSNIRDYVISINPVPIGCLCLHSYGQVWLWPYGYDKGVPAENHKELDRVGKKAVKALKKVNGVKFKVMNTGDFAPASGASDDWYKGVLKCRFSYTCELRDKGKYGFLLPEDQIIPAGKEFFAAFRVFLDEMMTL